MIVLGFCRYKEWDCFESLTASTPVIVLSIRDTSTQNAAQTAPDFVVPGFPASTAPNVPEY